MKITLVTVGKIKEKYLEAAIAEYSKRLGRYCRLEIVQVADEKTPDKASELQDVYKRQARHSARGRTACVYPISPCSPAAIRFTSSKKRLRPIRRNASPPPIPAHDTHTRQIPSNFIHI